MTYTDACWYCGNPATERQRLVWNYDGRKDHDHHWPSDELSDEEWKAEAEASYVPCPAVPEGWVKCGNCDQAVPAAEAYEAELHHVWDDRGFFRERLSPPTTGYEPFWERIDRAPTEGDFTVPEGTRGVVVERDSDGHPFACCADCARRWPEAAQRRRYRASATGATRDAGDTDDAALAALVPDSGVGVEELATLWGKGDRTTRDTARRLVASGLLEVTEVPTKRGGAPRKTYARSAQ